LVDAENQIIAGHGRVEAAKLVGMSEIPTVQVDHLTPAQIRAYVIADNKLAENAGWDRELLSLELKELTIEYNYDLKLTGFETAEIDQLLGLNDADGADDVPEVDRSVPAVSRLGDLWKMGPHYLLCGDATKPGSYAQLLTGRFFRPSRAGCRDQTKPPR
jgi:ParB-like chromosome segregation protein Spo0J